MIAWFNHQYVSVPDGATVSQLSPHFCFFETFAIRKGKIEVPDVHQKRIESALRHQNLDSSKLHLNFSDKIHHWKPILENLLLNEKLSDAIVRWVVIPHNDNSFSEWVTIRSLIPTPPSVDLFLLKTIRDKAEWLPRPKTGPWKNSQLALDELKKLSSGDDTEGLQLDHHGNISEGTRSALAWWDGNQWFTPSPETQCLKSTSLETFQQSLVGKRTIKTITQSFPIHAQSLIILRSTFEGGAVKVNRVFNSSKELIWTAQSNQEEADSVLNHLKIFRAQRSVILL